MKYYDYDNIKEKKSTCGPLKECFTKGKISFARATIEGSITSPHYHKEITECLLVHEGEGELRVRNGNEVESLILKPNMIVRIDPNEVHQIKSDSKVIVEAIQSPAWSPEDELTTDDNLFEEIVTG